VVVDLGLQALERIHQAAAASVISTTTAAAAGAGAGAVPIGPMAAMMAISIGPPVVAVARVRVARHDPPGPLDAVGAAARHLLLDSVLVLILFAPTGIGICT